MKVSLDGSWKEIEEPEDDPVLIRSREAARNRVVTEMTREKVLWFDDLFSHPWHSKLAAFFAREENGGLTADELKAWIRPIEYTRAHSFREIEMNEVEESEKFFNEVMRKRLSRVKVSACEKIYKMVKNEIAEFSSFI